jgi:hypothetical protein
MQLVVSRLDAAGVMANQALSRAKLEATVHSAEDRAAITEVAASNAAMERESLEVRLS